MSSLVSLMIAEQKVARYWRCASWQVPPLHHSIAQIEHCSIYNKATVAPVMDRPCFRTVFIDPDLLRLQNEEIVCVDKGPVGNTALYVSETVDDEWRGYCFSRTLRQSEPLELVNLVAGAIADIDDSFGEVQSWDRDHTFTRFTQGFVAMVPWADDATDERRRVLDHHVKG